MSIAQRGKNQVSTVEPNSTVNSPISKATNADQILQLILSDFASNLTSQNNSKIILLDSYKDLVNKSYTFNQINFVSGGKPEVSLNNGVVIAFWRMDIDSKNAHIEFFYTDSKKNTSHHEYLLTKENAVWRK